MAGLVDKIEKPRILKDKPRMGASLKKNVGFSDDIDIGDALKQLHAKSARSMSLHTRIVQDPPRANSRREMTKEEALDLPEWPFPKRGRLEMTENEPDQFGGNRLVLDHEKPRFSQLFKKPPHAVFQPNSALDEFEDFDDLDLDCPFDEGPVVKPSSSFKFNDEAPQERTEKTFFAYEKPKQPEINVFSKKPSLLIAPMANARTQAPASSFQRSLTEQDNTETLGAIMKESRSIKKSFSFIDSAPMTPLQSISRLSSVHKFPLETPQSTHSKPLVSIIEDDIFDFREVEDEMAFY